MKSVTGRAAVNVLNELLAPVATGIDWLFSINAIIRVRRDRKAFDFPLLQTNKDADCLRNREMRNDNRVE